MAGRHTFCCYHGGSNIFPLLPLRGNKKLNVTGNDYEKMKLMDNFSMNTKVYRKEKSIQ